MSVDPDKVKISDGLAKMREAAQQLTEEEIEALAEKARQDAEQNKKPDDK